MSLLVPLEIRNDISVHSGYIKLASKFSKKNLKGLFFTNENRTYLARELYLLLTNDRYVNDVAESLQVVPIYRARTVQNTSKAAIFKPFKRQLEQRLLVLMESYPLPHREDLLVANPVQQLSNFNKDFLINTSRTIIASPDSLIPGFYDVTPETGQRDAPEWDYGAASYTDGTWHPEHLFTQSERNRSNPYWVPRNITFDTNPPPGDDSVDYGDRPTAFHPRAQHYDTSIRSSISLPSARGREQFVAAPERDGRLLSGKLRPDIVRADVVDRKYVDTPNLLDLLSEPTYPVHGEGVIATEYHTQQSRYAPGPGPGNRYRYDMYGKGGFSGGGTFPRWQYSVSDRPYQRDPTEGLREGGESDRRTQQPHGYDMSALLSKSTV